MCLRPCPRQLSLSSLNLPISSHQQQKALCTSWFTANFHICLPQYQILSKINMLSRPGLWMGDSGTPGLASASTPDAVWEVNARIGCIGLDPTKGCLKVQWVLAQCFLLPPTQLTVSSCESRSSCPLQNPTDPPMGKHVVWKKGPVAVCMRMSAHRTGSCSLEASDSTGCICCSIC